MTSLPNRDIFSCFTEFFGYLSCLVLLKIIKISKTTFNTNITKIIFKMAQFKILFTIAALFLISAFSLSPCAQKGYVEPADCMQGAVDPSGGNCWWAAVIYLFLLKVSLIYLGYCELPRNLCYQLNTMC